MPKKNLSNEITNWYKTIPSGLIPKYHDPSYENHKLKFPWRGLCIGASGSQKTTWLMDIIKRSSGTYNLIVLCVKSADEPLYNYLRQKVPDDMIHIFEGGDVPTVATYKDFDGQILFIADDLVNEPKKIQDKISEWWLRGRKAAKGCSMIYLSQSFFRTPKFIRINCNYIFLKKLTSLRDLNIILSEYALGISKDELLKLYEYATDNFGTLTIDIDAPSSERFRRNFLEILHTN